jgi:hypothetical protein
MLHFKKNTDIENRDLHILHTGLLFYKELNPPILGTALVGIIG